MSPIVQLLVRETGLFESEVLRVASSAPSRYKSYSIAKRSGGERIISQPAREVKLLQRALITGFLSTLPIHVCAMAYRIGFNLADNARPHSGHRPILKMDLKDFFPSIKANDWKRYCMSNLIQLSDEDLYITSRLLFHRDENSRALKLAIGAPSSPMLSNILMYEFDNALHKYCLNESVAYTRYADDLTFSAARTGYLTGIVRHVAKTIRSIKSPNLAINLQKTNLITTKYGQMVTSLILSNDGRATIGHKRKRELHAGVYNASKNRCSFDQMRRLAGMLAFANSVEPEFIVSLQEKYGISIIKTIQRTVMFPQTSFSSRELE